MDVALLLAFPAVKKVLDVIRLLADGDVIQWKAVLLTIVAWILGIVLVLLIAASSFAEGLGLAGIGWADAVLWGIAMGSSASALHDATSGGVTIL